MWKSGKFSTHLKMERVMYMSKTFLPVILGTDANAYGLARSFHDKYNIKSLAIGSFPLRETQNSQIIDVKIIKNLSNEDVLLKTLLEIGKEYKQKYDYLILLSCAEWYTNPIVNNMEALSKYFVLPFMDKTLKDQLEDKESFYNICKQYNLDYPKTYIVTKENKDNIKLPFPYPVALKPSNSTLYSKIDFQGKEKSYKIQNDQDLKQTIDKIFESGYNGHIIIQDFIPGGDDTMYVLNCYSNSQGKVKMMCLGQCILEEHTPYGIGNYRAIISSGNKEIYEKIQNFLETIKYVGFSNFDLKYDYRDNTYKLFEINIRQGRSSYFTTAAGLNMAKYLIEDYVLNLDQEPEYNYNKFLWLHTPKNILKKYVYNKETLNEALQLIKEKKYAYTLKNPKDNNLKRIFWINRIYNKDYQAFKLYPPKKDDEK